MPAHPVRMACLAAAAAAAIILGAPPAVAGGQSSNSSSNCSNGRCTRVDAYGSERGGFRHGWSRIDQWDERRPRDRGERPWRGYDRRHYHDPYWDPRWDHAPRRPRRRGGDRDD